MHWARAKATAAGQGRRLSQRPEAISHTDKRWYHNLLLCVVPSSCSRNHRALFKGYKLDTQRQGGVWFQIPSQSQVSPRCFLLIKEAHLNLCEKVKFNPPDHTSVYCGRACMGRLPFAVVKRAHTRSPSTASVYRKNMQGQSASLSAF